MNMITISILTFIFMPFLVIWSSTVYLNGANFYNHPSKIVSRQLSLKARDFRYYNELKHEWKIGLRIYLC